MDFPFKKSLEPIHWLQVMNYELSIWNWCNNAPLSWEEIVAKEISKLGQWVGSLIENYIFTIPKHWPASCALDTGMWHHVATHWCFHVSSWAIQKIPRDSWPIELLWLCSEVSTAGKLRREYKLAHCDSNESTNFETHNLTLQCNFQMSQARKTVDGCWWAERLETSPDWNSRLKLKSICPT